MILYALFRPSWGYCSKPCLEQGRTFYKWFTSKSAAPGQQWQVLNKHWATFCDPSPTQHECFSPVFLMTKIGRQKDSIQKMKAKFIFLDHHWLPGISKEHIFLLWSLIREAMYLRKSESRGSSWDTREGYKGMGFNLACVDMAQTLTQQVRHRPLHNIPAMRRDNWAYPTQVT